MASSELDNLFFVAEKKKVSIIFMPPSARCGEKCN